MKQILTICMMLISLASYSQDTLCVMICLDEVINFDYETSEIIDRFNHDGDYEIKVKDNEVLVLHFFDEKKRFRDVTIVFDDEDHTHNTFKTKDQVLYSSSEWPSFVVNISEARRKK